LKRDLYQKGPISDSTSGDMAAWPCDRNAAPGRKMTILPRCSITPVQERLGRAWRNAGAVAGLVALCKASDMLWPRCEDMEIGTPGPWAFDQAGGGDER
jgi:hypothetical protein